MNDIAKAGRAAGHIMYALYAISLVTAVPALIGVVVAYLGRSDAHVIYRSHLNYGIGAFWMSVIGFILAIILTVLTFGLLSFIAFGIVWLYLAWKTARGWMRLIDDQPAPGYQMG